MDTLRVISADSHMTEPPDLWTARLDRRFQDRAPRVVHKPDKPGHFFTAPGITPFPVAGGFSTGRSGEALSRLAGRYARWSDGGAGEPEWERLSNAAWIGICP